MSGDNGGGVIAFVVTVIILIALCLLAKCAYGINTKIDKPLLRTWESQTSRRMCLGRDCLE